MLYIVKIDKDTVYIKNTDNDSVVSMSAYNLILCCEQTGINCQGVARIGNYEEQKYRDAGFKVIKVSRKAEDVGHYNWYQETTICYILFTVDDDRALDTSDKYQQYKRYLLKCKLMDTVPTLYANNLDDITKTIGTLGFSITDIDKKAKPVEYFDYNAETQQLIMSRRDVRYVMKNGGFEPYNEISVLYEGSINDMKKIIVPDLADYIAFQSVNINYPCMLVLPDKDLIINGVEYITPNIVCKVPERLKCKFRDCASLVITY